METFEAKSLSKIIITSVSEMEMNFDIFFLCRADFDILHIDYKLVENK